GADNALPIGTECHASDCTGVPSKGHGFLSGSGVPHLHFTGFMELATSTDQALPIWTEHYGVDLTRMPFEGQRGRIIKRLRWPFFLLVLLLLFLLVFLVVFFLLCLLVEVFLVEVVSEVLLGEAHRSLQRPVCRRLVLADRVFDGFA